MGEQVVRYWIIFAVKLLALLLIPYFLGVLYAPIPSQGYSVISLFWSIGTIPVVPPFLQFPNDHIRVIILFLPSLYFTLRWRTARLPQARIILAGMTLIITWLSLFILHPLALVDFNMQGIELNTIPYLSMAEPFTTLMMVLFIIEPVMREQFMNEDAEKRRHWIMMIMLIFAPVYLSSSLNQISITGLVLSSRVLTDNTFTMHVNSPPSLPIEVFAWLLTLVFIHQLHRYLNGKVSYRQLRIIGILSLTPLIALSTIHFLISTILGIWTVSIPVPLIQIVGYVIVRRSSRAIELIDTERQELEVPTIYIIYSWIKKKIHREE